jgi:AmmeMemoRadiSam system protein B
MTDVRPAAVAGTWYPGSAAALNRAVQQHLLRVPRDGGPALDQVTAVIAPHAGLMYSGPVAAFAYDAIARHTFEVAVLVGPSHFVGFDGVSIWPTGRFDTPLGPAWIDESCASAIMKGSSLVRALPSAHRREHSLEMQLPFLRSIDADLRIVPLLMGVQTVDAARRLADGLAASLAGRRALLVASTDLSHYHDAAIAARLDGVVLDCVGRFDVDGLERALEIRPDHACGGGPLLAVMSAARSLGATDAAVLRYADSGDVSGDKSAVVGYMSAVLGTRRTRA